MANPSRQMDERFLNRIPSVAGNVVQSSNPAVLRIQNQNINPPPLPPRNYRSSSSYGTGFGSYHSPYSMYGGNSMYGGSSMYGGYGGYGGLGGYGGMSYGYGGGYGMHRGGVFNGRSIDDPENRFIQLAEESSRPAFESIESIVRTFASVTMMLESTFHAMQTSFHAVLGVAENCNRLRQLSIQIAKYMSAFAMLRTIYWFYRRVLYTLGLIRNHPSTEAVWKAAEKSASNSLASSVTTPGPVNLIQSTWPIVTFFGLLFGGPYVIFKLVSSIRGETDDEKWDPRTSECDEAVVLFSHRAPNENELSIKAGEVLRVPTPKYIKDNNCGWVMAVNQNNRVGLVPLNYIKRVMRKSLPSKNLEQGVKAFSNRPVVDNSLPEQVPGPIPNEQVIINPGVPSCSNPNSTKTVDE